MRDITKLMNEYRECARNLWNVYFAKQDNIGAALDAFERIKELLFESLVVNELSYDGPHVEPTPPPILRVMPSGSRLILINRSTGPQQAGYWDQEKDMAVGPDDIGLSFIDYFDFWQPPIKDFPTAFARFSAFLNILTTWVDQHS